MCETAGKSGTTWQGKYFKFTLTEADRVAWPEEDWACYECQAELKVGDEIYTPDGDCGYVFCSPKCGQSHHRDWGLNDVNVPGPGQEKKSK